MPSCMHEGGNSVCVWGKAFMANNTDFFFFLELCSEVTNDDSFLGGLMEFSKIWSCLSFEVIARGHSVHLPQWLCTSFTVGGSFYRILGPALSMMLVLGCSVMVCTGINPSFFHMGWHPFLSAIFKPMGTGENLVSRVQLVEIALPGFQEWAVVEQSALFCCMMMQLFPF
eukprot:Gb_19415 [translate_table: standard]